MRTLKPTSKRPLQRPPARGFTLVEVLVAMMMMALLATISWQGLDSILRARDGSKEALDRTQRLATVIVQWEQDLQSLHETGAVPALQFDGRTVRMTRRTEGGVALVAWSLRSGRWQRWVGPTTTRLADLQEAWIASQGLLGNEPGHLTLAEGASEWHIHFHRGGAWTNAQSTGDTAAPPLAPVGPSGPGVRGAVAREALPTAVRLVMTLQAGTLTRDIALGPSGG
ncbi:MAG: prepilin-type N-terminal cleavage/methylation domain-containing protein [Rubrivivax sp.]|nr:prepilin-type N-terminal cleavage/methylation domain-containing protein [Rubrivivax sp.]MCL4695968.1 prepilin-type N-terminal cleavage/methylation domain-containing protein [Burkholderiaceae bacterium]